MRKFSEVEVENWIKNQDENVLPKEEFLGRCFACGESLSELELPEGPEKKVVCLKDRDYFVDVYEELQELGEIWVTIVKSKFGIRVLSKELLFQKQLWINPVLYYVITDLCCYKYTIELEGINSVKVSVYDGGRNT